MRMLSENRQISTIGDYQYVRRELVMDTDVVGQSRGGGHLSSHRVGAKTGRLSTDLIALLCSSLLLLLLLSCKKNNAYSNNNTTP